MARGFDIEASNQGQLNAGPVVGPRSKYNFVETAGGLVIAVTDNPGNDSVDVSFDSSGISGVSGAADAGPILGSQPTVRLIAGTNITIGLVENVGTNELEFTIAGSAGAFPGFGGTPPQDAGAGSAGASGTASRSDHSHPSSTTYTNRDGVEAAGHLFSGAASFAFNYSALGTSASFRPRVMFNSFFTPNQTGMGVAFTTTPSTQRYSVLVNAQANITGGFFGNFLATDLWVATTISTTGATLTHSVGAATALGIIVVIGDNL